MMKADTLISVVESLEKVGNMIVMHMAISNGF